MGSVKTFPGIVTAVVGRCEATLDQRDLDAGVLADVREAQEKSEQFAAEEAAPWSGRTYGTLRRCPSTRSSLRCAKRRFAKLWASHRMPSGPLHDAAEVARAGIPTVMMFVQSLNGISHKKLKTRGKSISHKPVEAFDRLASKGWPGFRSSPEVRE